MEYNVGLTDVWGSFVAGGARCEAPELAAASGLEGLQPSDVLASVAHVGGEERVVRLGEAAIALWLRNPLRAAMRVTDDPAAALERLCRALRCPYRLPIHSIGDRGLQLRCLDAGGEPAPRLGALFAAGVVAGFLRAVGCQGLQVELPALAHILLDRTVKAPPAAEGVHEWEIRWRSLVPPGGTFGVEGASELNGIRADVASLIDGNLRWPWTLGRVATLLECSERTLQRRLAAQGESFSSVLRSRRLAAAARVLHQTQLTVVEVADLTGFADDAHLIRRFREVYGETPARWREAARPGLRTNIGAQRDGFFGRQDELEELVRRLRGGERLLTLLGPGGVGKTRLALQCAAVLQREREGGVWFFDLRDARTVDGICRAVARGLQVRTDRADVVGQLGWALNSRGPTLAVLDNLEQCTEHLPETLGRWLELAPEAQFLCTSRVRLALRGEGSIRLGPLQNDEAVALFLDRSPHAIPAGHQADVAAIVELVQGMPLAVELAAARVQLMPVPQLKERLDLALLSGGGRELPARDRSMEASLGWSWDLLSEPARAALTRLSVCEGGFDLAAAETLLADTGEVGSLDLLQELVDASWLELDPETGRFSMFALLQAFAAERLEDRERAEARHGALYVERSCGPADLQNLVMACRRALSRRDVDVATRSALAAWRILQLGGPVHTGVELLEAARVLGGDRQLAVTVALVEALTFAGQPDRAVLLAGDAQTQARAAGDAHALASVLERLGVTAGRRGEAAKALELLREALRVAQDSDDDGLQGRVLNGIASCLLRQGETEGVIALLAEAGEAYRRAGDRRGEGVVLGHLGLVSSSTNDVDLARTSLERSLRLLREVGDRRFEGRVLGQLGHLAWRTGRPEAAHDYGEAAVEVCAAAGDPAHASIEQSRLGMMWMEQGRLAEARFHLEAAYRTATEVADPRATLLTRLRLGMLCREEGQLDAALEHLEASVASCRTLALPLYEGVSLVELAEVQLRAGDLEGAARSGERAEALADQLQDRALQVSALSVRGEQLRRTGDLQGSAARLDAAEALLPAVRDLELVGRVLHRAALLELDRGQPDAAAHSLDRAEAAVRDLELEARAPLRLRLREAWRALDELRDPESP